VAVKGAKFAVILDYSGSEGFTGPGNTVFKFTTVSVIQNKTGKAAILM
jgi:hypothetical protein